MDTFNHHKRLIMTRNKLSRRELLKLLFHGSIGGYLMARVGLAYSLIVESEWLDIQRIKITLSHLPKRIQRLPNSTN